jgi:hypothetical protein
LINPNVNRQKGIIPIQIEECTDMMRDQDRIVRFKYVFDGNIRVSVAEIDSNILLHTNQFFGSHGCYGVSLEGRYIGWKIWKKNAFIDKYGGFGHLARKESQESESQECYKKQNLKILKSIRTKWGPMFNKRHDIMYQIEDPTISLPSFQMAINYYVKLNDIQKIKPTESICDRPIEPIYLSL